MSFSSRASRAALALFATLAATAFGVSAGCGNSDSVGPNADAGGDGSVVFNTVMTTGGGTAPPGATSIPFTGSSGGSSGASGSGSSGAIDAGSDADASAPSDAASDAPPYVAPTCDGVNPCDLRSSTCCLANGPSASMPLVGTCVTGSTASCPNNQATVHCLQSVDCSGGQSCCGEILVLLGQVEAYCHDLSQQPLCPFAASPTFSQIGVQLCKTDAECKNGQPCVHQLCSYGADVHLCGLQQQGDGGLLNCTAIP